MELAAMKPSQTMGIPTTTTPTPQLFSDKWCESVHEVDPGYCGYVHAVQIRSNPVSPEFN